MLKTFAMGGIHPPEYKLSSNEKIKEVPLPELVAIPLVMHLGIPAKPIVEKGDLVKTGQLIAKGNGFVSSNIHSPFSGKILKIDKVLTSSGYKQNAVFIHVKGDEWMDSIDRSTDLIKSYNLTSEEIIRKINQSGIVGLGGATFPSHVKLAVPRGKKADHLIINGVECEPYLTADHALMLEKAEELMVGIGILQKALNVENAILGIENNKADAIINLNKIARLYPGIKIRALKVKYPQGGEKQLIKALLNREVPSGKLPLDVGTVVFNVGTAFAVYEAVQKDKPLFERIITVTGKSLKKPSNFRVRIGTPVKDLIEASGGLPEDSGKIINGGPMMGRALPDINIPIVKGSSGILVIPKKNAKRKPVAPCIRCSKCVHACPMGLEPYLLMALGKRAIFDGMEKNKIMDCIECGSCSYICPASRPLLDFIRYGKTETGKILRLRKK